MKRKKKLRWVPFQSATIIIPNAGEFAERNGCTIAEAETHIEEIREAEPLCQIFKNNIYQVSVQSGGERCVWLSIKRIDRKPIHDWRDLQRIKNEIVGPECEAVELYPAESRLVDEANQFHLWVFEDGVRLPIGFNGGRKVSGTKDAEKVGAKQRPFIHQT